MVFRCCLPGLRRIRFRAHGGFGGFRSRGKSYETKNGRCPRYRAKSLPEPVRFSRMGRWMEISHAFECLVASIIILKCFTVFSSSVFHLMNFNRFAVCECKFFTRFSFRHVLYSGRAKNHPNISVSGPIAKILLCYVLAVYVFTFLLCICLDFLNYFSCHILISHFFNCTFILLCFIYRVVCKSAENFKE